MLYVVATHWLPEGDIGEKEIEPTMRFTKKIQKLMGAKNIEPTTNFGKFCETRFDSIQGRVILKHLP